MHAGIIDKFNCNNVPKEVPSVYVDEPAWQGMTLDAKKNLAITAGVNCGSWNAVVYSAQTGKELAYYTEKYGFNFFK